MRKSLFGDWIVESKDDDLGDALMDAGTEIYAELMEDTASNPGMWAFEVRNNEDGECVVMSDPIFASRQDARAYVRQWVKDVQ